MLTVLNAFRHHRNLHTVNPNYIQLMLDMCSTPFGIIGIFTALTTNAGGALSVLNAFRHHRNLHCVGGNVCCCSHLQETFQVSY